MALRVVPPGLCLTYAGDPERYISAAIANLQLQNERLREEVDRLKIVPEFRCRKCDNYIPGHATGGFDICTCETSVPT